MKSKGKNLFTPLSTALQSYCHGIRHYLTTVCKLILCQISLKSFQLYCS